MRMTQRQGSAFSGLGSAFKKVGSAFKFTLCHCDRDLLREALLGAEDLSIVVPFGDGCVVEGYNRLGRSLGFVGERESALIYAE
jgi:hypothetical protein